MASKIKIFISYSHSDKKYINDFEKYFKPLEQEYNLDVWRDNQIKSGEKLQHKIYEKLNEADIVLLFISAHFLSSDACKKEMEQSLKLREERNLIIIPIILSTCEWKETILKDLLCVPKDGKPVSDFEDKNKAWQDVSNSIKEHIEVLDKINHIEIKEDFKKNLQDTEVFKTAHHDKKNVSLDDIFISPQLECFDENRELEQKNINYKKLEKEISKYKNIVIAGDGQSGKTTLCKKLFTSLKEKNFLPVYIFDEYKKLQGKITDRIEKVFKGQYDSKDIEYSELKDSIIPIIDDFHLAQQKQKIIENLSIFKFSILITDDIYGLNIKDKDTIKKYKHFKINEFSPSLRNELIKKWNGLTDSNQENNDDYKELDEITNLVNTTLGKIIGNGIVPSYPFFILTILMSYETANPLDENITSQGHCYQALIYIALRKEIENKDVDVYLNFLTVISFKFFTTQKKEFNKNELEDFIKKYQEKYNLPVKIRTLLQKLDKTKLLTEDSLGNASFCYDYLYFYFVAKYLAEHIDDTNKIIDDIISNLHKNENAYIAIFLSHHSKNDYILDEIVLNAMYLFEEHKPATLKKDEVNFLDEEINDVIQASLPNSNETPESHRDKKLKEQDKIEKSKNEEIADETDDPLDIEIRRSIKTVEVMGRIIRNRSGSLIKDRLGQIFEYGMNIHLRLLKSFLEAIQNKESQEYTIDFIKNRLEKIIKESKKEIREEKLKEIAKTIFWNLNFGILYGIINKTVHSLGSDNLTKITNEVCDDISTPASFLVKHGILMWYSKNIQIDNIYKKTQEKDFSYTAKHIIKHMIVNHCAMHLTNREDRQKLETKLGFSAKQLLLNSPKKSKKQ